MAKVGGQALVPSAAGRERFRRMESFSNRRTSVVKRRKSDVHKWLRQGHRCATIKIGVSKMQLRRVFNLKVNQATILIYFLASQYSFICK
jgi:hypothetical protein